MKPRIRHNAPFARQAASIKVVQARPASGRIDSSYVNRSTNSKL